jgi:hypothetical protein
MTVDVFDRAWKILEEKGHCDAMGGMEYKRLRSGWDRVLGVLTAIEFIKSGANASPNEPELLAQQHADRVVEALNYLNHDPMQLELPDVPPDLPPIPPLTWDDIPEN